MKEEGRRERIQIEGIVEEDGVAALGAAIGTVFGDDALIERLLALLHQHCRRPMAMVSRWRCNSKHHENGKVMKSISNRAHPRGGSWTWST